MLRETSPGVAAPETSLATAARSWRPRLREGFAHAVRTLRLLASRRRERRALAELAAAAEESPHLLRDVGVSRGQARRESAKPFWRS